MEEKVVVSPFSVCGGTVFNSAFRQRISLNQVYIVRCGIHKNAGMTFSVRQDRKEWPVDDAREIARAINPTQELLRWTKHVPLG